MFSLLVFLSETESPRFRSLFKPIGLSFPVGLDDGRKIADSYKFIGTPFTVVISKDGEISNRTTGPQSEKTLRAKIEKLLKLLLTVSDIVTQITFIKRSRTLLSQFH